MAKQSFTTGQVLTAAEMTTLQINDYNQTVSAKVASYVLVAADAGTRITMSNAAATTVTVNTALFAAGDTLTITNIGAGVCTITAGTATVSTAGSLALNQYDSGTLYFTSTGVSIWNGANPGDITGVTAGTGISGGGTSGTVTVTNSMATAITTNGDVIYGTGSGTFTRLGIGSSAQVLTVASGVPSWATPASGGGWTSIGTATLSSSVTSVSFTATGYQQICLQMTNVACAAGGGLLVYPNGGTAGTYIYDGLYQNNTASQGRTYKNYIYNGGFNLPTSGNYMALVGYFDLPASTTAPKPFRLINAIMDGADVGYYAFSGVVSIATSALSSFSFTHQGGNFTGGSVTVWGIK